MPLAGWLVGDDVPIGNGDNCEFRAGSQDSSEGAGFTRY